MPRKKIRPVKFRRKRTGRAGFNRTKKAKKSKKVKKYRALLLPLILAIIFLALLFFLLWQGGAVPKHDIFISSENPKQGDTVLIKVNGRYPTVSGFFNNKNIIFSRNGKYSDWYAFLGIDANSEPGKYKILVSAPGEQMEKEINVETKDFPVIKIVTPKELQNKGYTEQKVVDNIQNNDNPALNQILEEFTPKPYFNSPFVFPLGNMQISGLDFGEFVKSKNYQLQHFGVDLRAGSGTEVCTINDGKVVMAKELSNYGKTVVIDHGLGIFSLYLHLDEFMVSEEQLVKKSQIIGLSGNSGYSIGPHLHFSIRNNGTRVDPISFIKKTEETAKNSNLASIGTILSKIFNIGL